MANVFRERCLSALSLSKADSILLFNGDSTRESDANFHYLSGTEIDNSCLLATRKGSVLWTSKMNLGLAKRASPFPVKEIPKGKFTEVIKPLLRGSKLGLDMDSVSAERYLRLRRKLGKKVVGCSDALSKMRAKKTADEIAKIARAVKLAKKILCETEQAIDKSMTEWDVRKELLKRCIEYECEPAFEPIVATGKSSTFPHYKTGKRKLDGIVLIDFGVKLDGYCSDLTRCFFLGECRKERDAYAKAQDIFNDIVEELPNLKKARELALFSEKLFASEKLPKPIHAIGHGIGMEVHESPRLNAKSKDRLVPGMALAIEPAAYFRDFGVRYEETLVLGKARARVL